MLWCVLKCVEVCCSVLPCAAVCCRVLPFTAVCCRVLPCAAVSCLSGVILWYHTVTENIAVEKDWAGRVREKDTKGRREENRDKE